VNTGKVNRTYSLSYVNPYFTVDGVSQGFDAYYRTVNASSLVVGPYATKTLGGGLKFGYPVSEIDTVNFGVNAENVTLELFDNSPLTYRTFATQFGNKYSYGAATAGWARDARDSAILTTRGHLTRAAGEIAAGDLQYYRLNLSTQWYYPITPTFTFSLSGDVGYVNGLSGKPVPFFKNFFAGGPGSIRGYRSYSVGPQDAEGNVLGGTRKISGSAEIYFPVPGAQQDKSLRLSAFLDAGQAYGEGQKFDLGDLRYSAGIGLAWNSPFGPLKVSFAHPLNRKAGFDRVERLQLNIGTTF
jgi:outer membrane protein insertion porin family